MCVAISINFVTNACKKVMIVSFGKRLKLKCLTNNSPHRFLKTYEDYIHHNDYFETCDVAFSSLILSCTSLLSSNSNDFW